MAIALKTEYRPYQLYKPTNSDDPYIQQQESGFRATIDGSGNVSYIPSVTNYLSGNQIQHRSYGYERSNEEPNPYSSLGPHVSSQMTTIKSDATQSSEKSWGEEAKQSIDNAGVTQCCNANPLNVHYSADNSIGNGGRRNAVDLGIDVVEAVIDARSGNWIGAADKSFDVARGIMDVSKDVGEAFVESRTNAVSGGYTQYSDIGFQ